MEEVGVTTGVGKATHRSSAHGTYSAKAETVAGDADRSKGGGGVLSRRDMAATVASLSRLGDLPMRGDTNAAIPPTLSELDVLFIANGGMVGDFCCSEPAGAAGVGLGVAINTWEVGPAGLACVRGVSGGFGTSACPKTVFCKSSPQEYMTPASERARE